MRGYFIDKRMLNEWKVLLPPDFIKQLRPYELMNVRCDHVISHVALMEMPSAALEYEVKSAIAGKLGKEFVDRYLSVEEIPGLREGRRYSVSVTVAERVKGRDDAETT